MKRKKWQWTVANDLNSDLDYCAPNKLYGTTRCFSRALCHCRYFTHSSDAQGQLLNCHHLQMLLKADSIPEYDRDYCTASIVQFLRLLNLNVETFKLFNHWMQQTICHKVLKKLYSSFRFILLTNTEGNPKINSTRSSIETRFFQDYLYSARKLVTRIAETHMFRPGVVTAPKQQLWRFMLRLSR